MHARNAQEKERGFTLIELLIVIGIIGFLAASVLVAVDPVKRIQDSRDARRFSEANGILNAILNKQVDDTKIYVAAASAPIITASANSQVIVTSDAGIECDAASVGLSENFPGCGQTLDTSARTVAGNVSASGTVVTGSGTDFLTSLRVGDTIVITATGLQPCTVLSIASDTSLTCTSAVSYSTNTVVARSKKCVANLSDTITGLGTITTSGVNVTGSGTNFTAQVNVGDTITVSGQTLTVATIGSNGLSLTTTTAASPSIGSATAYTVTLKNPLVPNYIASAPIDPRGTGATVCQTGCTTNGVGITTLGSTNTGYYLHRTTGNRLEVGACQAEQMDAISVKR